MIHSADFKRGMRRLVAGVSVITTAEQGTPHGFAATAVTSVSADPTPTLLICVNTNVTCHDAIMRTGIFCVNLLAEDDAETAKRFSSAEGRERRFADVEWRSLATGAPALVEAIASFDCMITNSIPVHSHTVFIATVVDVALRGERAKPLLYADGRFDALRSVTDSI
jgi:flavin reductase